MSSEFIEEIEDLLLECGISSPLTGIEISHLHVISLVINMIITDIYINIRGVIRRNTYQFSLGH